jgi:hypothetical protein
MTEDKVYDAIEAAIIRWNLDGTKTAGELTREIMLIIKKKTMADKQTAVEWLMDKLKFINKEAYAELYNESFEEARKMEETQGTYTEDDLKAAWLHGAIRTPEKFAYLNNFNNWLKHYKRDLYEQNNLSEDPNSDHQG